MERNIVQQLFSELTSAHNTIENTTDAATIEVLDLILRSKTAEFAMRTVMLGNNSASMFKNTRGKYASTTNKVTSSLLDVIVTGTRDLQSLMPSTFTLVNQAMVEPNIAGIPISSPKIETNKDVEVSEQQVILQDYATKQYWTDNAVPRLKEWTVTGYLTSFSPVDSGLIIKPSLTWQIHYLELCADSRRPVLFKTNRNEFVKVQITNLHTIEEASYNNAIEVSISLKEYNPFTVTAQVGTPLIASYQGTR